MHYEFVLSNCTTTEAILLWLNLGVMFVAMIGFGMMVANFMNRNCNILLAIGIGALLMFFPTSEEKMGIMGTRMFLISISICILLTYIFVNSNMYNHVS
jgi:hypothetical protein